MAEDIKGSAPEDRVRAAKEYFEQWWIKSNPSADTSEHAQTLLSRVEELQAEVQKHQMGESYELGYQRGTDAAANKVEELQQQVAELEEKLSSAERTIKSEQEISVQLMAEAEKAKGELGLLQ